MQDVDGTLGNQETPFVRSPPSSVCMRDRVHIHTDILDSDVCDDCSIYQADKLNGKAQFLRENRVVRCTHDEYLGTVHLYELSQDG